VEATSNVQKRLEFIGAELERLDSQLKAHQDRQARREQQVRLEPCRALIVPCTLLRCSLVWLPLDGCISWALLRPLGRPSGSSLSL